MKSIRAYFTSRLALAAALGFTLSLAGCTGSSINIGDGGSDAASDGGIACGSSTCGAGEICCDTPCELGTFCAAAGEGCPALDECPPPPICGSATCGAGEVCCAGCAPGEESCFTGGCPPIACPPPPSCADGIGCGAGELCCPGCAPGEEFCSRGGCPDLSCPPPPTCVDGSSCSAGEICCDNPCDGTAFCTTAGAGCPVFDCPPPPICGTTECAPGEACCADCDGAQFCSAGGCPAMPCPPPPATCDPQDAAGEGLCDGFFGYAWNGSACTGISGCSCVGTDCDSLSLDPSVCAAAHSSCTAGATCGGFAGPTCASGEFCDYTGTVACGAADGPGTCAARPEACTRVYDPVCGCDGRDYANECIAHLNGTDVSSFGTCDAPGRDCRTTGCATGSSCIVCGPPGTGFSCVPDGTVCPL